MEEFESVLRNCWGCELFIFRQEWSDRVFSHELDALEPTAVAEAEGSRAQSNAEP
jgi:hypothetical protein